ncbi:MAG: 4Fe-4S dicluster domain-containing protein, partial [Promethearchaeota archaeon]
MSIPARIKETEEPIFKYRFILLNHERCLEFNNDTCVGCGLCVHACPAPSDNVIVMNEDPKQQVIVDVEKCVHCGVCAYFCPTGSLKLYINGEEKIELKEPAGEIERHSLPDFKSIALKHKEKELEIKK